MIPLCPRCKRKDEFRLGIVYAESSRLFRVAAAEPYEGIERHRGSGARSKQVDQGPKQYALRVSEPKNYRQYVYHRGASPRTLSDADGIQFSSALMLQLPWKLHAAMWSPSNPRSCEPMW